jgi:DNA gyrase subunit A
VRGITLREDDAMVGMAVLEPGSQASIVSVCEHGFGKRTNAAEFGVQRRGGIGLIAVKTSPRNGPVVGTLVAEDGDELMVITDVGKVIRMPVSDMSLIGRNTQGVRLIRLEEEEKVVSVERLAERDDDPERGGNGATPPPGPASEEPDPGGDGGEIEETADDEPEQIPED